MEITVRAKFGATDRSSTYDDVNDIILGRPGAALPLRQRRIPRVFLTGNDAAADPGVAPPILLDLTPDSKISRVHARLYYEMGTWWLEPLSSVNKIYLNAAPLESVAQLEPADIIRTGDTLIAINFQPTSTEPDSGTIENAIAVDETQPDLHIREDRRLEILNRVSGIIAQSSSRQSVVDGVIRQLGDAYPKSSRRTLVLIEDRELVARAFWPPDQSRISFTLARRALQTRESLHWHRKLDDATSAHSLIDVTDALYAPMIVSGAALGVLHVDSVAAQPIFSKSDLELLTILATTIGGALREVGVGTTDGLSGLPSVFVSYAHRQRVVVDRLVSDLRRNRVKVWVDERLQSGDQWRNELASAIARTNALVVVVSADSIASEWVQWEVGEAKKANKPVLPIMFENCDLPDWLSSIQYAKAHENYENAVRELAERARQTLLAPR
jgi:hypothetical protein